MSALTRFCDLLRAASTLVRPWLRASWAGLLSGDHPGIGVGAYLLALTTHLRRALGQHPAVPLGPARWALRRVSRVLVLPGIMNGIPGHGR